MFFSTILKPVTRKSDSPLQLLTLNPYSAIKESKPTDTIMEAKSPPPSCCSPPSSNQSQESVIHLFKWWHGICCSVIKDSKSLKQQRLFSLCCAGGRGECYTLLWFIRVPARVSWKSHWLRFLLISTVIHSLKYLIKTKSVAGFPQRGEGGSSSSA